VAERKRLKKMRIKGVFDDDPEMFDQELARVRRELNVLPTPTGLAEMKQAVYVSSDRMA
jgi:hypothetical protein